ncbi:MAG: hypothetical protein JW891_04230 [Candidatus Lokiarchaeota archaeon]|nr:hypothetical protein [Candidatus Lokiarchaeota archaeon]
MPNFSRFEHYKVSSIFKKVLEENECEENSAEDELDEVYLDITEYLLGDMRIYDFLTALLLPGE